MNLISCDGCGVVIDSNKINDEYIKDSDDVIISWLNYIVCPVCKQKIDKKTGEIFR